MRKHSTYLYCFSPPVMLATFLIEITGAMYIIWRYKMTAITRLITAILLCLATFQGAEYMLCGGIGIPGGVWSQVGYSAITLLPPLGIHLSLSIADKKAPFLLYAAYISAAIFVCYFAFITNSISGHTCYANYAVFEASNNFISAILYGSFYYGWLFVGVWVSVRNALQASKKHIKTALLALAAGYSAFIIPTTFVNIIDRSTMGGIPSIMCGFAVILAFVLLLKVAPESVMTKDTRAVLPFKLPF